MLRRFYQGDATCWHPVFHTVLHSLTSRQPVHQRPGGLLFMRHYSVRLAYWHRAYSHFSYDANGNMTKRIEGGVTYDPQRFDAQNRLISVTRVGTGVTTFTYDAAGIRVKTELPNGSIIYTPFPHYEDPLCQ